MCVRKKTYVAHVRNKLFASLILTAYCCVMSFVLFGVGAARFVVHGVRVVVQDVGFVVWAVRAVAWTFRVVVGVDGCWGCSSGCWVWDCEGPR